MQNKLSTPIVYTANDYKLLVEFMEKTHVFCQMLSDTIKNNSSDIVNAIETFLLKEPFMSKALKEIVNYMYYIPIDELPLYINNVSYYTEPILKWRLKIKK